MGRVGVDYMEDKDKTRSQLIDELAAMRKRIAEVETLQTENDLSKETIRKLEYDLRERTKEISCLYSIGHGVEKPGSTLEEILQGIVNLFPQAWQYPEIACGRIIRGTQEFRTDAFKETPFKQASDIAVRGNHIGAVEVFYLEERPDCEEGPFLKEERSLIDAIAGRLGKLIEQKTTEEIFRKSEERYRSIFEYAVEGIFQTTPEGKFLNVNPSYVKMFGYSSPEEFTNGGVDVGRHVYANPDDRTRFKELMDEQGVAQMFEFPALRRDGARMWVCLNARAVRDDTDTILYYEGTIEDITLLKQAEEALLESEQKYRLLIENSHDIIYTLTPQGVFTFVSPSWTALLGHPVAEVVGKQFQQFIHPDDIDRCDTFLQRTIGTGQRETGVEYRVRHADGSWRWHNSNGSPLRDNAGTIVGFEGCASDITLRKLAEEELRHSEATLSAAINAIYESLIMIDHQGMVLLSNTIGAERLGKSVPDLLGTCLYDHLPPDVAASRKEHFAAVFKTGEPVHFEDMRAGRHFESYCCPIVDEGGGISRVAIFTRDITGHKMAEEKLKQQADAMGASADGMAILNKDQKYVYVNKAYAAIYGYDTAEELIGQSWRILYDVDEKERFDHFIMPKFGQNGRWQGEATGRKKDGSLFLEEVSLTALDNGGLICIVHDITERKRVEEALKESESRLQEIFDTSQVAIILVDSRGVITFANKRMSEMFGQPLSGLIGSSYPDHLHPNEKAVGLTLMQKLIAGEIVSISTFERHYIRPDGGDFWGYLNGRRLTDARGNFISLVGIIVDITDRKKAEEELRIAHQQLFDIIEFLPDATFVIDEEKKVLAWNLACEEMTGVKKEEIIGKGDYAYSIPFYGERRLLLVDHVTMDSDELQKEYTSIRRKGHLLYAEAVTPNVHGGKGAILSCKASPLFDRAGKVVGAIESLRDITEIKHLETRLRQSQKMESIGTLAGGIAHDFNNILTSLMGYTSLIQMKMDKDSPLRSYVDQVLSASQKAADLTRSLLTFSRQQPVTLAPLDMNDTIKGTKKLLKRLLTEDIELRTSLAEEDTVVMADKSQLDQILFNLVTNARDAMPNGGRLAIATRITDIDEGFISTHGFGKPGRYFLLSVSDTGIGMDDSTREKIFDPFFTTKETGKGTGLGLATVYGIIKQHNGHVSVYSELGHGTTFRIYLPAVSTKADEEQHEAVPINAGDETILIAEDNKGVRHFMQEALHECGYKTIEAIDGEDAIDKFKQHRDIDLIVVDSVMPKKNGREVYEEIHGINPHVKVLFTSGYTKDIVLNKGIKDKEFNFIAKPLSLNQFLKKVREVLDR